MTEARACKDSTRNWKITYGSLDPEAITQQNAQHRGTSRSAAARRVERRREQATGKEWDAIRQETLAQLQARKKRK